MRAKGKPFVVYRRADFFTFVPQGFKGWFQLAVWFALIAPMLIWFTNHLREPPQGKDFYLGVMLFIAYLAAWIIGGVWWLFAHAQQIDMTVHLRDQQMAERKKRIRGD